MKLVIFNGSPRKEKSNSSVIMKHFLSGYCSVRPQEVPIHFLAKSGKMNEMKLAFQDADTVIFIFPLYTDCMPGVVKEFFEIIMKIDDRSNKRIGYIVQSGFPESIHSVYLERFLAKYTKRLNCEYTGTIIKGGIEGIQVMPAWMTKRTFAKFRDLGQYFATHQDFSYKIMEDLRKPYKMSLIRRFGFYLISKTGMTNYYWNYNLKKHNAFDKRFDRPYVMIENSGVRSQSETETGGWRLGNKKG